MVTDAPRALSDAERLDWLRLLRTDNVGPITFFHLLRRYGTAAAALEALPELVRRGGRAQPIRICAQAEALREAEATAAAGARLVAAVEPDYPRALAAIDDAPPLVSLRGRSELLRQPCIAVVGARNASAVAVRFARDIAGELGRRGFSIVSGLARGIDGAAHEGSLASGTVAVLGGGIDVVYPSEHQALQAKIAEHGLLVAESPVHTVPQARHFPRRNRIISGLSLGVLVVEAAVRSGSLITARMALEQGREVFAVPGSPLDPRARGTNDLIRQGATLVESADDVTNVLSGRRLQLAEPGSGGPEAPAAADERELAAARRLVLDKLTYAPVEVDELMRQTGLAPGALLTVLLELELAGRLARHPGNKVALA
ncbi:MAG TPA: DNA-processing protein DprA [Candidatus Sulfotelmatobacter sp.]|nr:DNA-processing protein DprA [Candidatus Sulfotelmatobacter sp.]